MESVVVRPYIPEDLPEWTRMRTNLWPDQTEEDQKDWLSRQDAAILVATRDPDGLCGFAEVGSRSFADGCAPGPVAYLEGWYVDPDVRQKGVGRALIQAARLWAKTQNYSQLASDTALDNSVSQTAHEQLGFVEVERCVLYRMDL